MSVDEGVTDAYFSRDIGDVIEIAEGVRDVIINRRCSDLIS